MLNQAHCLLEIKSIDEEQRIIEGLASTPELDRQGDIMESAGAKFDLPMPLLWQHKADEPIGQVIGARLTPEGIYIRAQIAAKGVLPIIDERWAYIKSGLVRGFSIGWKALTAPAISNGTRKYSSWLWAETSTVTVPANASATIRLIKSLDAEQLAASGIAAPSPLTPSGVSDTLRAVKAVRTDSTRMKNQTITEQIGAFEATRQTKTARMTEMMQKAADAGLTLDAAETEEYDTLENDIKSIDAHLTRLKNLEAVNKAAAVPVAGESVAAAAASRGKETASSVISVKSNLPKGTGFTRYVMALVAAKGDRGTAIRLAENNKHWMSTTPEVAEILKTGVDLGTTTSGSPADYADLTPYQNLASEFIELLRPETLLGKINGFRNVPFNVKIPVQTAGTEGAWVGEGEAKPVGKLTFSNVTLRWTKVARIVAISEELARFSNPAAEGLVSADLRAGIVSTIDITFIDPANTGSTDVKPASITNGAGNAGASGTGADDLRSDLAAAFAQFNAANIPIDGMVWVMQPNQAAMLALLLNPLGQPAFPGMSPNGGTLLGFPVVVSQNVPSGVVVIFKPSEILLADDGAVAIDVSREATLVMDDGASPASTQTLNLWQQNAIGVRAERFINWLRRRDDAVYYITGANYGS